MPGGGSVTRAFRCGHPHTPENTKPNGPGKVTCRACRRVRDRARPEVRRARQGREHNRYRNMKRKLEYRIAAKRARIAELKQELNHE